MTRPPLKVLYVIDKMVRAGAQRHLRGMLPRFDRREIAPVLCCLIERGPLAEELAGEGIPVECLGLTDIMGGRYPRAVLGLREIVRRRGIDLVHSYLFAANLVAPPAGLISGRPVVTSRRDTGFWKTRRHVLAHRAVNPLTRKITANSRAVAEYLRRREMVGEGKIALIHNGVELPPREEAGEGGNRGEGRVVIGALGNIRPVKGYPDLIRAAGALPGEVDWEVRVAGRVLDPEHLDELKILVREKKLGGRVVFTGEAAEPEGFIRGLDILVLPSRAEGFSNTLLEAMVRGCPVLASAVGANPEVITEGVDGFLFPPGDFRLLGEKLARLCREPELRDRIGRAGRERAERDYSLDRMCRSYRDLYYEVAEITTERA